MISIDDIYGEDHPERAAEALHRYALHRVASPDDPLFEAAFDALYQQFGVVGELERRSVLETFCRLSPGYSRDGYDITYHLIVAQDRDGSVAGVRDCHVVIDRHARRCVVYLAHTVVRPDHRRTGLATILRSLPATLGRRALLDTLGSLLDTQLMLAAEMEFLMPENQSTIVRFLAYGRAGFSAIDPAFLPSCQPDFADPATRAAPVHLPLLAVVRWVGHEEETTIPVDLAASYVRHVYAVHSVHADPAELLAPRSHALNTLYGHGLARVPLLRLPRKATDLVSLVPLLPHRIPLLYPEGLRGPQIVTTDEATARAELVARYQ